MWRQSMRMSRKAILAFRFSSKDDTDSRSHALVVKVYWLSCDKTRRLQSPLLKTRGLKPKSSSSLTSFNTAIGAGTLLANTADGNTVTGIGALFSNTTGPSNTATGAFALSSNTINLPMAATRHRSWSAS